MTIPAKEKHIDILDRASQAEMAFTEASINAARRANKRMQEPDEDGKYLVLDCIDCGDEIGDERLKVATKNKLCIHCATARERRAKQGL